MDLAFAAFLRRCNAGEKPGYPSAGRKRALPGTTSEAAALIVGVPAAYTSQTCAACGVVDARSRPSQAVFACVACGHRDHADANAAKVIQALGRRVQASTVEVAHAVA